MNSRGYTLIEVLVAASIFVGVLIIVTTSFTSINRINEQIEDIRTTTQTANFVLETLSRDIRSSTGVRSPDTGNFIGDSQFPFPYDFKDSNGGFDRRVSLVRDSSRIETRRYDASSDSIKVSSFDFIDADLRKNGTSLLPTGFAIKQGSGKFSGMSPYAQTAANNPVHPYVQIEFTLVNSLAAAPFNEYTVKTVIASREFLD